MQNSISLCRETCYNNHSSAEKLSWARTHGSTRWGVHHTGTFKVYAPRACLNLHEKVTQHSLWGKENLSQAAGFPQHPVPQIWGLTEGTVTSRQLKNVLLLPERPMKNCTNSVCGPGLPEESSTCRALPWSPQSQCTGMWGVPLQSVRAPQGLD